MQVFISKSNSPFYNLALEEVLLKNGNEDFFLLYRNKPSVIIGKHQIPYCEVDYKFIQENNILIARRLSGGGTVYHDLGNLNFSFILNTIEGKQINFRKYSGPILDFLKKIGVNAYFNDRNDILLNGKKISGNAEHVYKNRVLHHGTLLYNSTKDNLSRSLAGNKERYKSKAVESVRRKVCNIKEESNLSIQIEDFEEMLYNHIANQQSVKELVPSDTYERLINELADNKYSTEKWNFEYSPKYQFENTIFTKNGTLHILFESENMKIRCGDISSDFLSVESIDKLKNILSNKFHHPNIIAPLLNEFCIIHEINQEELIWNLF